MQMLQSTGQMQPGMMPDMPTDLTLEINASHPTIINLNTLRKADQDLAKEIGLTFLDQIMMSSQIPSDLRDGHGRSDKLMEKYLEQSLAQAHGGANTGSIVDEAVFEPVIEDP